jgi:hypothetical protein
MRDRGLAFHVGSMGARARLGFLCEPCRPCAKPSPSRLLEDEFAVLPEPSARYSQLFLMCSAAGRLWSWWWLLGRKLSDTLRC